MITYYPSALQLAIDNLKTGFRKIAVLRLSFGLAALIAVRTEAMDIPYDYQVPLTPENAILGYFSPTKKPVVTIKSGDVVKIDGGGGARWGDQDPDTWLKENGIPLTVATSPALAETIRVS